MADGGRRNGPLGGSSPREGMMFVDEKLPEISNPSLCSHRPLHHGKG